MPRLLVQGGYQLKGNIRVGGAKNAVLKLMAAALLGKGEFIIRDVPDIKDVSTMVGVIKALGVSVEREDHTLRLEVAELNGEAPANLVSDMRASIQVIGPLLAKRGYVTVSMPGGCAIGARPIDLHLANLRKLGAEISFNGQTITAKSRGLKGTKLTLDYPSVGATENLMMAATLAEGRTTIHNAAREPEIIDAQRFLNSMGAQICGGGSGTIYIDGVKSLGNTAYTVIPDRIEAGTYLIAGAITRGELTVENVVPEQINSLLFRLRQSGLGLEIRERTIKIYPMGALSALQVQTAPYPGFPTDLQPQLMALLTVAQGTSTLRETVYNNRFRHVTELRKMGADIVIEDNTAYVNGVKRLKGGAVSVTDLRAGAALMIAALGADGESEITNLHHIERGYEDLEAKLQALGGKVTRED